MIAALAAPNLALADGGLGFRVDGEPGSTLVDGFIPLTGSPGQTISGHFVITNTQQAAVSLSVYPADGLTGTTTGVVYGDKGDDLIGAGAWVSPDRTSAQLGPYSEQVVQFSVRVPAGATPGDHVAGVVLEQRRPGSTDTGAISQVVRNVVPVMILVPGPAGPQIDVKTASLTNLPGSPLLAVTVVLHNTGLELCRPVLTVDMGDSTDTGTRVVRQLDTILPGDRAPYPLPWPKPILAGTHLVHVSASRCGVTQAIDVTVRAPRSVEDNTPNTSNVGSSGPDVVTDAVPTAPTFIPAPKPKKHHHTQPTLAGVVGASAASTGGTGGSGSTSGSAAGAGKRGAGAGGGGAAGSGGPGWIHKATTAVGKHAPAVLERAIVPLSLLALIGLVFFMQEAIDRKDPKLALAPLHREPDLGFVPDPFPT